MHEALGHRLEGSRLLASGEGQTFRDALGEELLPEAISMRDDPRRKSFDGQSLVGHFRYDDEGVEASEATLVSDGKIRGFLTTRAAIGRRHRSNGHARKPFVSTPDEPDGRDRRRSARRGRRRRAQAATVARDRSARVAVRDSCARGVQWGDGDQVLRLPGVSRIDPSREQSVPRRPRRARARRLFRGHPAPRRARDHRGRETRRRRQRLVRRGERLGPREHDLSPRSSSTTSSCNRASVPRTPRSPYSLPF